MQINKNSGQQPDTAAVKTKPSAQSVPAGKTAPLQNTPAANVPRSVSSLINAAGLPQDKLSASIVSLARFFSLSLKPEQLAAIRRQAFSPPGAAPSATLSSAASPGEAAKQAAAEKSSATAEKIRQVFSLAAAAAESKGVELQPKGLALYADTIDPDLEKRQDNDGRHEKRNKEKEEQEKDGVNAAGIKKIALDSIDNNPVLSIMNKLPGKNNQRWVVIPFEFSQNGRDFRVSMRVLFDIDNAVFAALDITEPGKDTRYSFAMEIANNKVIKLGVYMPDHKNISSHKWLKEMASIFEIPAEKVFVKTGTENLAEAEHGEKLLRFVDEAV